MFEFYEKPDALEWKEWDKWESDTKAKHPVQYFFRETLPGFFRYRIFRMRMKWWSVLHRIHPRHRYHVIKPRSLKPGHYDPSEQILHVTFDLISVYAERQCMGNGISGTQWTQKNLDDFAQHNLEDKKFLLDQINTEKKIIDLRNWWVNERPKRREQLDAALDNKDHDRYFELEQQFLNEDTEKLKEAADINQYLWYL